MDRYKHFTGSVPTGMNSWSKCSVFRREIDDIKPEILSSNWVLHSQGLQVLVGPFQIENQHLQFFPPFSICLCKTQKTTLNTRGSPAKHLTGWVSSQLTLRIQKLLNQPKLNQACLTDPIVQPTGERPHQRIINTC